MNNVVIVHQWGGSPTSDWYPWLAQELRGRGAAVMVPTMPDPDAPRIDPWVNALRNVLRPLTEPITLIGHSVGCQAILRALEGLQPPTVVAACYFVAGWLTLKNLSREEQTVAEPWLVTPMNFSAVRRHCPAFTVLLSDDDPYVPAENADLFRAALAANVIMHSGRKHFSEADGITSLPEILPLLVKT